MNLIVVKNGHERHDLATVTPGDVIASWWWDADRGCHVIEIATGGVPASVEVTGEGWNCELRGHRHWLPNGLPTSGLYVVVRFDAFQMDGGKPFSPEFVTAKRNVYDRQIDAETEAARLNLQAPAGAVYFARQIVPPVGHVQKARNPRKGEGFEGL